MLDKIIQFSIKNKLAIGIMTLALIIWGVWSASKQSRAAEAMIFDGGKDASAIMFKK